MECNYYYSSIAYFDRMDYVSTITQELLVVHALERLMNCYGNCYDSIFRTILLELYRILNHSLAITTHAIDIGLFTTMLWSFEERETFLNLIEAHTGTRFHGAFLLVSRLRYDMNIRLIDSFIYSLVLLVTQLKEIHLILSSTRLWRTRLFSTAIIERDYCLHFGLSGLLSRSTQLFIDARFSMFLVYYYLTYSVFLTSNGDCLDRYLLRFNEMIESARLIYSALDTLFNCYYAQFLCTHYFCYSTMELLIADFLLSLVYITSFLNELESSIESSKGIYSIY
jgi:NADH dehydrogenase (ubiquinone) Fe-S protein 2